MTNRPAADDVDVDVSTELSVVLPLPARMLVFTFMLGSFPAGLVIYWTWNNLLSVTQQGVIMKKSGVKIELWDNLRNMFSKSTG